MDKGRGASCPRVVLAGDCLGYVKMVSTKARPRPRADSGEEKKETEASAAKPRIDLDDVHTRHLLKRFETVSLNQGEDGDMSAYETYRHRGIVKMCFSGPKNRKETRVALALASGEIRELNLGSPSSPEEDTLAYERCEELMGTSIRGMGVTDDGNMVACAADGQVIVKDWQDEEKDASRFNVGEKVAAMKLAHGGDRIAVGGNEHLLELWDIEKGSSVFKARNVKHDKLDMRVPVWITDLDFVADQGQHTGNVIACVSGYGHIRIYDARAQRRAVRTMTVKDAPHMMSVASVNPRSVHQWAVVSDTMGNVGRVDLGTMKLMNKYSGFSGSVRSVTVDPSRSFVASCGLDRRIHVHHIESKKTVCSVYAKQWLNCAIFFQDGGWYESSISSISKRDGEDEASDGQESDDEDVWRQLDEANAARTRQQKREEKILESDDDFSDSGDDDDGSSDDEDRNPKRQKR